MPETVALLRLALLRNRGILTGLVVTVLIGQLVAWLSITPDYPHGYADLSIIALAFSLLPAAIASIALFNYGYDSDMASPDSGCSPWLLRMPIARWKIALVPIALKTAWISCIWMLFVYATQRLGVKETIPAVAPCFAFSAAAISILVISWRPFRSAWGRLATLLVCGPLLYILIGLVLVAPSIKRADWRPLAVQASMIGSILFYVASVVLAIRAAGLATTAPDGLIPASPASSLRDVRPESAKRQRSFSNEFRALLHHEYLQLHGWVKKVVFATVLPFTIFLVLFCKLSVVAVGAACIGFAYFSLLAVSRSSVIRDGYRTLPPYLAASPLRTSTIAWARFASLLSITLAVYSLIGFVLLGWGCWPSNREIWSQWAADRALSLGNDAPFATGLRWSLLVLIAWPYAVMARMVAYLWIDFARRQMLAVVAAVVAGLVFLVPMMALLLWFMQQSDWETTKAEAIGFLKWIPGILVVLLSLKGTAVALASWRIIQDKLISVSELTTIYLLWTVVVGVAATVIISLIPDPRINDAWVFGAIVAWTPLCRMLLMPIGLAWDRHR
jgi:hypothetical protein